MAYKYPIYDVFHWFCKIARFFATEPVIVSETGWPSSGDAIAHEVPTTGYASEYLNDSSGNTNRGAVPSPENASKYLSDFLSWARKNNVKYFYFEAFDETWKAISKENSAGAHWGIWDKDGNTKSGTVAVLLGFPVVNFTTNVTQGYAPLSVQFTDLSENATEWKWNFGDGATSNEQNPSHIYSAEGIYTVSLIVNKVNRTTSIYTLAQ